MPSSAEARLEFRQACEQVLCSERPSKDLMKRENFKIGFVRRGYSPTGGAEAYLRRLAHGVVAAGHEAILFTSAIWPETHWPGSQIYRVNANGPLAFADELDRINPWNHCHVVMSLERIWRCDFFRAGDGLHRAWLERRATFEPRLRKFARMFNRKHAEILELEKRLLGSRGAGRVIANSAMVRDEIVNCYAFPAEAIDLIRNGVSVSEFGPAPLKRAAARAHLHLAPDDIAVLFVGSGWERKGLRFAIAAIESLRDKRARLLVVGRGNRSRFRSRQAEFFGETSDVRPFLAAADIFFLPTLYDPFSNASLEAMAAGLPVITTRANGCSEVIQDTIHGSIVDRADNLTALTEALLFWSDESRRKDAQLALLEQATEFDLSRNVSQTLQALLSYPAVADSTSGKMRKT
jgi:UDP-glucose:(heptosyl)LPS alpha-1,3-glucosyltransferase